MSAAPEPVRVQPRFRFDPAVLTAFVCIVVLLLVGAAGGAHLAKEKIIDPYLAHEKGQSTSLEGK